MVRPQVVVFGLDGATFQVMKPLIAKGKMPNIGRLMAEGTSATLKSTIHPITPSAWASMVTGLNPGKHGVFDFRRRKAGSYELELVNGSMRDGRPLWSILNEYGKKTGMLNIPLTYPPDQVDGFMVSGMDAPSTGGVITYPRDLYDRIQQALGRYIIDFTTIAKSEDEYLTKTVNMLDNRIRSFHFLCDQYPHLDFLFVVFVAPDRIQHAFWKYLDACSPDFHTDKAQRYRSAIERAYTSIDEAIGWAISRFGDQTYYLVVSDHGFGPLYKDVYMNKWLSDLGLLKFKEEKEVEARRFPHDVDWNATKAYSFGYFGNININLIGREPDGVVSEGQEAEEIKKLIIRELHELRDPESAELIVDRVFRKEELYSGPYFFTAPDLLIIMKNYTYMTRDAYEHVTDALIGPPMKLNPEVIPHSGNHNLDGIFILRGKGVKPGGNLARLEIVDIAPTVLHLMDLPISPEIDGRVPEEALERSHLRSRPIKIAVSPVRLSRRRRSLQEALVVKDAEIARLQEKLKDREEEIAELKHLLARIYQGRFMRFMAQVHALRKVVRTKVNLLLGRASPPG